MSIELINVIETYQIGDNDVYDFIVKIDNGKYKVRYIDYWLMVKVKGVVLKMYMMKMEMKLSIKIG